MARAIERLFDEHRRIERVLGALERWTAEGGAGTPCARRSLADWVRFFREFADRAHHAKEEDRLFRVLREHDALPDCGPVNRFLQEHAQGRATVARLARLTHGDGPLTADERAIVELTVGELCELLRGHIHREDRDLLPGAARVLPADALRRLDEEFDAFEREAFGPGGYARLVRLADRLGPAPEEDRHGVHDSKA